MKLHFEPLAIVRLNKGYYEHRHYSDWIRMITHNKALQVFYVDSDFFDAYIVNGDHRSLRKARVVIDCDFPIAPEAIEQYVEEATEGIMGTPILIAPLRSRVSSAFSAGALGVMYFGIDEERDHMVTSMETGVLEPVPKDLQGIDVLTQRFEGRG